MKILTKYEELVGKTIAFSHMAQFAENITLATEDGCVLVATQTIDDYGENKENRVLWEPHAIQYIENNKYIREQLGELGIFDIQTYKQKQQELEDKRREEYKKKEVEHELMELQRLKKKYES